MGNKLSLNFVETDDVKRCVSLVNTVMESRTRMGRIIGFSGAGKSEISLYLEDKMDVIRICVWQGISAKAVLELIAGAIGISQHQSQNRLMMEISRVLRGERITLVIDECNHLNYKHLEMMRYLSDECELSLILIGTPLFEQDFNVGKSRIYYEQLRRRIGTKQVTLGRMDIKSVAAFVIQPRVKVKVTQQLAKEFYRYTDGGQWGLSVELMDACERLMCIGESNDFTKDIILAAAQTLGSTA